MLYYDNEIFAIVVYNFKYQWCQKGNLCQLVRGNAQWCFFTYNQPMITKEKHPYSLSAWFPLPLIPRLSSQPLLFSPPLLAPFNPPPHFLSLPSPIPKQVHLYLLMAPPPPPPPSHVSFLCLHFPSLTPESSPFLSLNLQSCFPSFPSPLPFLLMSIAILGPSLVSLVISTSQHPQ